MAQHLHGSHALYALYMLFWWGFRAVGEQAICSQGNLGVTAGMGEGGVRCAGASEASMSIACMRMLRTLRLRSCELEQLTMRAEHAA